MVDAEKYRKQVDEWNALPIEKKREIEHSKVCYFCGGHIRTIAVGAEGWETYCESCDFLYDED